MPPIWTTTAYEMLVGFAKPALFRGWSNCLLKILQQYEAY